MPLTSYGQKKLGDLALGIADWTMPSTYLGIFTASPGETGSLTSEFSGGSYTRQALTAAMSAANATTGISTNSSAVSFPAPTATLGLAAYLGILDASSSGNMIYYAPLANPRVINNGDAAVVMPVGSIAVSIVGSQAIMLSSYLMKKLVDHSLGKSSYSKPSVYHGLLASNPTIAGTISSEVGVGGYLRQALTASMSAVDATDGTSSNTADISYPTPTADYPTVNYSFGADAASAGNLLFANQLASALSVRNGSVPVRFPAGSINFRIE